MGKLLGKINNIAAFVAGVILLFVAVSISYGVLVRTIGGCPPIWITQIDEYAMVWVTFLAAAWLLPDDRHVSVDLVVSRISAKGRAICRFGGDIAGMLLCGALCYLGSLCTWENYRDHVIDVQSIDVPKAYVLVVIPFGFLLLFFGFVLRTVKDWRPLFETEKSQTISGDK